MSLCKLHGKGGQALWCHLVLAHEHKNVLRMGPATLPKQTYASSTNWTQFLCKPFALHVHPCSLGRNGVSTRLQIHLPASGMEAHWSVVMLLAVKRKCVRQTHCILTSSPCQGPLSQPDTSQKSKGSLGQKAH